MKIKTIKFFQILKLSFLGIGLSSVSIVQAKDTTAVDSTVTANASAPAGEDDLATRLANPLASMISVPFQNNFDFGGGPNGDGVQWRMNVQPVIPMSLNEDWNLITRFILPVISQTDVIGTSSQSGLGDTVMSAWLSPVDPTSSGWIWGVGVAGLLPTGTEDLLTANQWGVGPTFVALKQQGKITYGMLMNQLWSADTPSDRSTVNQMFLQPFFSYLPGGGWTYSLNTETTCNFTNDQWTVPINAMVSKMVKIGDLNTQWQLGARYYAEVPEDGPEWGLRFAITLLFPR